jgi:hypothetical protein
MTVTVLNEMVLERLAQLQKHLDAFVQASDMQMRVRSLFKQASIRFSERVMRKFSTAAQKLLAVVEEEVETFHQVFPHVAAELEAALGAGRPCVV